MSRRYICQMADGDPVDEIFLVRDKQIRANRNGQLYLQIDLDDRTGSVSARYWNASESDGRSFEAGDFLRARGKAQLFQGQLQLIVHSFERCQTEHIDLTDFIPSTDEDIDGLLADLKRILSQLKDHHLLAIGQAFMMDEPFMKQLSRAPAGIRNHHAYVGGLLEHVVTLLKHADRIADLYPHIHHDVLKMGIFLHDIGKIRELSFDRGFAYTDEGQLIGHLVIGVEMLDEKVKVAEKLLGEHIPTELVLRLKHLILSHHGMLEFGSPKLPMTVEAIALHHLDNFDAKVHNFSKMIRDDQNPGGDWTPFDPSLGRRLFKGKNNS